MSPISAYKPNFLSLPSLPTNFQKPHLRKPLSTAPISKSPFSLQSLTTACILLPTFKNPRRLGCYSLQDGGVLVAQNAELEEIEDVEHRRFDWGQQEEEEQEEVAASSGTEEGEPEGGESGGNNYYSEPPEDAKLFVGNLPFDVDSENLAQLFDQAGVVEIAEVIYNRQTGRSCGFGFVTMSTVEEADKAIENLNRSACVDIRSQFQSNQDYNGRLLTVNKALPQGSQPPQAEVDFRPEHQIHVGNLPWEVDNSQLKEIFSEHGTVVDAKVIYDRESRRSRGFGFVKMSAKNELDKAIAALDGQSLGGRSIRVSIAGERPRPSSF